MNSILSYKPFSLDWEIASCVRADTDEIIRDIGGGWLPVPVVEKSNTIKRQIAKTFNDIGMLQ